MPTNWETAEVLKNPMEICWQFDYEISREKLKNLYSKSKRLQWDAEQDLDWSIEIDPSKPIVSQSRNGIDQIPFTVLIARDGTVAAINLRGAELESMLANLRQVTRFLGIPEKDWDVMQNMSVFKKRGCC